MKHLILKCACGKSLSVRALDVAGIMKSIDASGWEDGAKGKRDTCPACLVVREKAAAAKAPR